MDLIIFYLKKIIISVYNQKFFSLLLGFITSLFLKEYITPILLSGKGFDGRSYHFQLLLICIYALFFAILIFSLIIIITRIFPGITIHVKRFLVEENSFWVFPTSFSFSVFLFFVIKNIWMVYNSQLLIPGLAPAFVIVFVFFLIFPLIFITNTFSQSAISKFENHWIIRFFQKYSTLFVILFSTIMILCIFGKVLAAKWSVIDDHEIMLFLGRDGKLNLGEIFSSLRLTEIGSFGSLQRYRPSYYVLRLLECVIWGANPTYWFAIRLFFLILAVSLFWNLFSSQVGWTGGGLLCAYSITFYYWVDIVGRLGPGENYLVLGLPIYIWGLVHVFQENISKQKYFLSCLAVFLGSIVCVGSKENMVLLFFPTAYLAIKALIQKKNLLIYFTLGSILFSIYVGIAVAILIFSQGMDIYGHSVLPLERMRLLFVSLQTQNTMYSIGVLCFLIIILSILSSIRRFSTGLHKTILKAMFWIFILCIIYISQLIFYNGNWPQNCRYDFPGMLYIPATIFILFIVVEKISTEIVYIKYPQFVIRFCWIVALAILVVSSGFTKTIHALENNVSKTQEFTNRIQNTAKLLNNHPEKVLVLESGNVWDYEPIVSYERFLRAYGVNNLIFLRINGYSPESENNELTKSLANISVDISSNGNAGFSQLFLLENYKNQCYSLFLSEISKTECQIIP